MSILHVSKNNFDSIKANDKPILLDFYADWCGPCRMVSPIIEEIAKENPQYLIGKVNIDKEPELAQKFNVLSIPTLTVIKDGKVISQSAGARPKNEILAMLKE
ncbi:MAG: thioredoxin [Eubacterium sp.]|jgi:thioredoxin 1|nr:thioredoxin [Eubacterium sp.]NBI84926.1 thioredoxin [Lachnospiraceae bacterium]